jgi:hypothetical protein
VVFAFDHVLTPRQTVESALVDIAPYAPYHDAPQPGTDALVEMTNVGSSLLSASLRHPHLYVAGNDGEAGVAAVRVTGIDVEHFPKLRIIADQRLAAAPDAQGYGALAVNKDHDVAVVHARSGPRTFPSVAYGVLFHDRSGFGPGRILRAGESALQGGPDKGCNCTRSRWGDIAGAAVDPQDETSIWLTHTYTNASHGADLWVAKVLSPPAKPSETR